ncbi:MAG: hypothetical protein WBK20_14900 [Spirochaetota bacterium]
MIVPVQHTPVKPILLEQKRRSSIITESSNDILAPMKRFKKELPVPQLGQQPNLSLEKSKSATKRILFPPWSGVRKIAKYQRRYSFVSESIIL